jgi:hypothetical protein
MDASIRDASDIRPENPAFIDIRPDIGIQRYRISKVDTGIDIWPILSLIS